MLIKGDDSKREVEIEWDESGSLCRRVAKVSQSRFDARNDRRLDLDLNLE